MTSINRSDIHSTGQPKSTWGPGKNTALSFVAFAVIFGIFASVKRDARDERADATHDASGVVKTAVITPEDSAVVAAATPPANPAANIAQTAPPPAAGTPAKPDVKPAITPRIDANAAPRHARPAHSPSVAVAANTHAAPATGSVTNAHRHQRTHDLASARTHMNVASRPQPQSQPFSGDIGHLQTTSVTRTELEGARALARARFCAQVSEWRCVEQNASRALALDPGNSESRALLGQAIRNSP